MDMEKQKNKAKNTRDRLPVLKFISGGVVLLSLLVIGFIYLITYPYAEIQQTSLPNNLVPVAQSVLDTVSIGDRVAIDDDISLSFRYFARGHAPEYTGFYGNHTICVVGSLPSPSSKYQEHSRVFVNGSRIYGNYSATWLHTFAPELDRCVYGNLEPGLHLIEFHLRDSFLGAPLAIQQWAIEIE